MTPEHWEKVALLHRAALQQEESRRAAFLHDACAGDEDLRGEVESLLAYEGRAENFMEVPALDVVVKQLAESQALPVIQKSGTKLGPYEILAPLGAGGMGEVYRASDSKLNRDVALKILPAMFTNDAERMARFRREAQVLASLNHPNIGSIYGLEDWNNLRVLVLELVEGPTLADRITGGAIPLEEVLAIARQIAEALAYAHEKGVIHRDLKPANIKITPEGNVKVLDFGLAKVLQGPKDLESDPSQSPTYGNPTTLEGMILGTAAYMSPEQAKGKRVDKRSDIWAFGVVLYELLTGVHLFQRDTMSDTLAAVLKEEPDWNRIPVKVQSLLRHCLEKDPKRRLRDIGDMHLLLETASAPVQTNRPWLAILGYPALAAGVLLLVAGTVFFIQNRSRSPALPRQRALTRLTFDDGLQFGVTWSPDSRFIAYSSDRGGKFDIWVQQVSGGDPVQITKGPGDKSQPDWSPDGKYIAYRSEEGDGGLFIIPALGGAGLERPISSFGYYPRWSPDSSRLLFQSAETIGSSRFYVVGTDGEPPRQVLTKFTAGPYENHPAISAAWHPDGQRISVWVWDNSDPVSFWTAAAEQGAAVKSQISPEILNQIGGVSAGSGFSEWADDFKFSWAPSGKAMYFERTFRGVRNIWRMTVDPITLQAIAIERVTTGSGLETEFSLSPDGKKLAFTGETKSIRAWMFPFDATRGQVTGSGRAVTTPGTVALRPVLSRDGKRLAFCGNRAGSWGLREVSISDNREVQIVPNDLYGVDRPQWSPDGTQLAYARANPTTQESQLMLWSSETHKEEPLTTPSSHTRWAASDWSPDGKSLLMIRDNNDSGRVEIWQLPVAARPHAEGAARRIISNPEYDLDEGQYSPDARWIVFEGLRNQPQGLETTLYVMAATGGQWIRITDGKHLVLTPCWSPDGKTIYFVSGRSGFLNVWGIRFDPAKGKPVGLPFSVTALNSFSLMVPRHITASIELSLTQDQLVLPLAQESGSIWVLDHVDQ